MKKSKYHCGEECLGEILRARSTYPKQERNNQSLGNKDLEVSDRFEIVEYYNGTNEYTLLNFETYKRFKVDQSGLDRILRQSNGKQDIAS